jgi:hypothetical protein
MPNMRFRRKRAGNLRGRGGSISDTRHHERETTTQIANAREPLTLPDHIAPFDLRVCHLTKVQYPLLRGNIRERVAAALHSNGNCGD